MREEGISEKEEMVIIKTIPAAYAKIKGAFPLVNEAVFHNQLQLRVFPQTLRNAKMNLFHGREFQVAVISRLNSPQ